MTKHIAGRLAVGCIACVVWQCAAAAGWAQVEEIPAYVPAHVERDASAEAQHRGELRRRAEVASQISTIQYLRWLNGLSPTLPLGRPWVADRAAFYAYSQNPGPPRRLSVFEPWPYLPGDIWGFVYDRPVPQSVGQRQVQTGPNSWESYPVYVHKSPPPRARSRPRSY